MSEGVSDHVQVSQEAAVSRAAAAAEETLTEIESQLLQKHSLQDSAKTVCRSCSITMRAHESLYNPHTHTHTFI